MESKKTIISVLLVVALALVGVSSMIDPGQADATEFTVVEIIAGDVDKDDDDDDDADDIDDADDKDDDANDKDDVKDADDDDDANDKMVMKVSVDDGKVDYGKIIKAIKGAPAGSTVAVIVDWEKIDNSNSAIPKSVMDELAKSKGVKLSVTVEKEDSICYRIIIDSANVKTPEGAGTSSIFADFEFSEKKKLGDREYVVLDHIRMTTGLVGSQMFETTYTIYLNSTGVNAFSLYDHKVLFDVKSLDEYKFHSEPCLVDENCSLTFITANGGEYRIDASSDQVADSADKDKAAISQQTLIGMIAVALIIVACIVVLRK